MLSKATVVEDEGERDESAEIKVTLDPEEASNLITSQSSNNKWVDGYLKEDRFRPPFGFKSAKQKLKLSHLSGGNYLLPVELEMPNTLPGFRHLCFHWKLEKLDSAKITNEGSGSQNKRPIIQPLKANLSNKEKRLISKT